MSLCSPKCLTKHPKWVPTGQPRSVLYVYRVHSLLIFLSFSLRQKLALHSVPWQCRVISVSFSWELLSSALGNPQEQNLPGLLPRVSDGTNLQLPEFQQNHSSRGTVKAKSDSRDQASLGDSSVFPLSAGPSSVSGLGSPTGTVSVWWHGLTCRSGWWGRGTMGQSGLCRREVALGDRSGDSLVITICCSYISQLFPLSLSHFHKNILNQEVVGNTALSEFSSGQNLILKGSSSN